MNLLSVLWINISNDRRKCKMNLLSSKKKTVLRTEMYSAGLLNLKPLINFLMTLCFAQFLQRRGIEVAHEDRIELSDQLGGTYRTFGSTLAGRNIYNFRFNSSWEEHIELSVQL